MSDGEPPAAAAPRADGNPVASAEAAELAWAERVRANRDQVDRVREAPDGVDFYATTSSIFRADPDRTEDPVLEALLRIATPDDTWLDVGAGAGRYALPLARAVREVVAIEPSDAMRSAMVELAAAHHIENLRVMSERWPMADAPGADVGLIAHVGYDIEAIGPFLDGLEASTARACVAVLMDGSPATAAAPFFEAVHGEARVALPALNEFVELLRARGRAPHVEIVSSGAMHYDSFEELLSFLRRQTWVALDGDKDRSLASLARERAVHDADGWSVGARERAIGIVRWAPR